MPGTLQRVGHILRHIRLIMLGQHFLRLETMVGLQRAECHHALPLAKQIRQYPRVAHVGWSSCRRLP